MPLPRRDRLSRSGKSMSAFGLFANTAKGIFRRREFNGGPLCFSPYLFRARNLVERFCNKIKQCRRVASRYDKLAANDLGSMATC